MELSSTDRASHSSLPSPISNSNCPGRQLQNPPNAKRSFGPYLDENFSFLHSSDCASLSDMKESSPTSLVETERMHESKSVFVLEHVSRC